MEKRVRVRNGARVAATLSMTVFISKDHKIPEGDVPFECAAENHGTVTSILMLFSMENSEMGNSPLFVWK
jgi:hypothetical protein